MAVADKNEEHRDFYSRDPQTGVKRVNWGLLRNYPVCGPPGGRTLVFLILSYLQVDLWLKKWRRR